MTPENISNINSSLGIGQSGAKTPAFDPNAPAPAPVQSINGVESAIGNGLNTIKSSAEQGGNQIENAVKNSYNGTENPLLAGTEIAGGVGNIIASPLAPIFGPLSDAISKSAAGQKDSGLFGEIMNHLINNPDFQKFANSSAGQKLATGAKVAGNLASAAGGVLGAEGVVEGAPNAVENVKQGLNNIKENFTPEETETPLETETKPPSKEQQNLTQAQIKAAQAQADAESAAQAREQAGNKGVESVKSINQQVASHKTSLGQKFMDDAAALKENKPELKSNITNEQMAALNSLKEGKNFVLPKELESNTPTMTIGGKEVNLGPAVKGQLESEIGKSGSEVSKSIDPVQAQNLMRELNRSTYKQMADGTTQIDYQRAGITNELKNQFSNDFGKEWDDIYSNYAKGRAAIDKIDNLINIDPKATPEDIYKQLNGIRKMSLTPEGRTLLQQSINEYKKISGIDLTDPVNSIRQISDAAANVKETQAELKARNAEVEKAQEALNKLIEKNNIPMEEKIKNFLKGDGRYLTRRIAVSIAMSALLGYGIFKRKK